MKEQQPYPKKRILKKLAIAGIIAAAAAYGTLSYLNRDPDPTTWKGQRSGYEETK